MQFYYLSLIIFVPIWKVKVVPKKGKGSTYRM